MSVGEGIALDLQDILVDRIEVAGDPNEVSLESLMGSQAMTEFGGSVLPVGCCSCCIPCCCCCG